MLNNGATETTQPSDTDQRIFQSQQTYLIDELSQRVQAATSIKTGLEEIATAFSSLNVVVERITITNKDQVLEHAVNQHVSGVRRNIEAKISEITICVTCVSPMSPEINANLQSLVTMAAITAQQWDSSTTDLLNPVEVSRMIGCSPEMRELTLEISRAARSTHNVMLTGETGTGKTTAATMIHEQSARADKPFIDLNCAALPEALLESELFGYEKGAFTGANNAKKGLFELASGGTLFLDEIGEMKIELQAKLLTAIEQKKIRRLGGVKDVQCDVRAITASSRNIETMIKNGTFREDLYYRIAVLEIRIPPLRERISDIPALIQSRLIHEQQLMGNPQPFQIENTALDALTLYDWPGNIRQLQNIVSRLTARLDRDQTTITQADIYSQIHQPSIKGDYLLLPADSRILFENESLSSYAARVQLAVIQLVTEAEDNNHTQAAKRLQRERTGLSQLRRKLLQETKLYQQERSEIHLAPNSRKSGSKQRAIAAA